METIILGIDPGFAITGFGILKIQEKNKIIPIEYGSIMTSSKESFDIRLKNIYNEITKIIKKYNPQYVCLEDLFFCNNVKTAIKVGQSRGVIMLCAALSEIPVYEFTPLQVKQSITGYGKADKKQIQEMIKVLLNLNEIPKPDDAADALAVAFCGAVSYKLLNFEKSKKI